MEKNRDVLSDDFKRLLSRSLNPVISNMWPEKEEKKRRILTTAGDLFRTKMINLINLLRSKVEVHQSIPILDEIVEKFRNYFFFDVSNQMDKNLIRYSIEHLWSLS